MRRKRFRLPDFAFLRSLGDANFRGFEKGLADGGGWREEILPMPEIQASFLHSFSYPSFRRRGTLSGDLFLAAFWALLVANPSRQPLFETSEN